MQEPGSVHTVIIVIAVLLFFFLGIAILVIMDHKAKIPMGYKDDPFSIAGTRRNHPFESFLVGTILLSIITVLIAEITVTVGSRFGLFQKEEHQGSNLIRKLSEQRLVERNRHFHNSPVKEYSLEGKKPVCFLCHGDFPHSKLRMVRTLLNMHTQFLGCMTCHADARKVPEEKLELRWLNYTGIETQGPPFGTDLDPETGFLIKTDDYYSKIVPYLIEGGEETLLEIPEDSPEAAEFAAVKDKLSDRDREAVKKSFHRLVSPKGRFCSRCHTQESESYVPFRRLGFSEVRITALTNLNIVGLVQKYRTFYIPNLLKTDKSLPSVEVLTGPGKQIEFPEEMREDPRSWWLKTFDQPAAQDNGGQ